MTALCLAAVAALLFTPDEDAAKKEQEKWQGTWTLKSVENNGAKMPEGRLAGFGYRMTVTGDRYVHTVKGMNIRDVAFTLDPTAKPKTIDTRDKDNKTEKGIYELDGDTLRVCLAEEGKDRPTEFSAKEGTRCSLMVFKREKK